MNSKVYSKSFKMDVGVNTKNFSTRCFTISLPFELEKVKHAYYLYCLTASSNDTVYCLSNSTENKDKLTSDKLWERDEAAIVFCEPSKIKCYGCRQQLANQEAHMDIDGCLFVEDD